MTTNSVVAGSSGASARTSAAGSTFDDERDAGPATSPARSQRVADEARAEVGAADADAARRCGSARRSRRATRRARSASAIARIAPLRRRGSPGRTSSPPTRTGASSCWRSAVCSAGPLLGQVDASRRRTAHRSTAATPTDSACATSASSADGVSRSLLKSTCQSPQSRVSRSTTRDGSRAKRSARRRVRERARVGGEGFGHAERDLYTGRSTL